MRVAVLPFASALVSAVSWPHHAAVSDCSFQVPLKPGPVVKLSPSSPLVWMTVLRPMLA